MRLKFLVRDCLLRVFDIANRKPAADDVVALCYHSVDDRDNFHRQMKWLVGSGHTVISADELILWLRGEHDLKAPGVLLTFDDCYATQYQNAFPELLAFKLPAVFFPILGDMATASKWKHESHRVTNMPLMDESQLSELAKAGYTIGCHTQSHPRLSSLTSRQSREEIEGSRRTLQRMIRQPVEVFCYPYGDYSDVVVDLVRQAGFRAAFTTELGTICRESDPLRLKRLPIHDPRTKAEFLAYLSGAIVRYRRFRLRLGV